MTEQRWGALPEDWLHLDLVLGLTADLLPVVSNPEATISPMSKMRGLGKTPSRYNSQRQVGGIKDWTSHEATPRQLEAWAKESDYGICIQTRRVRALDIDVPDMVKAAEIEAFVLDHLGIPLPRRWRRGTGKVLLAFIVEGQMPKRSFKCDGGLVEFLANGQQFVACGTHTDGSRYEWVSETGDLPDWLPVLTVEAFDALWAMLVERFAISAERTSSIRQGSGTAGAGQAVSDDIADWLEENHETYGFSSDGERLYVLCPWKDGHSIESGETEACWLLAGTRGYELGHFECLHASCSGRGDAEFLKCVGYEPAEFEPISSDEVRAVEQAEAEGQGLERPAPRFTRVTGKGRNAGKAESTINNVRAALLRSDLTGWQIAFDEFRAEKMVAPHGTTDWRPYTDTDGVELRGILPRAPLNFEEVGRELMRDAVEWVARERRFDTAVLWLETVVPAWDGVERVAGFFPRYFGVADGPYARAVGRYSWTAQVGRVMEPGCKADMVPVLQGAQGQRKSWGIAAIAPAEEFFAEINLEDKDTDLSRLMRGTLVAELGELKGLSTRAAESIKAWLVKRHEKWTPKYLEYATTFPRRCIFYGSTNPKEFLSDDTGERRWLPMVSGAVDVEGIVRDRLQLWAEALVMWRASGIAWREAEDLARGEHAAFKQSDVWAEPISAWLHEVNELAGTSPADRGGLRLSDIAQEVLGLSLNQLGRAQEMRIAKVLKALGMESRVTWVNGKTQRLWFPTTSTTSEIRS